MLCAGEYDHALRLKEHQVALPLALSSYSRATRRIYVRACARRAKFVVRTTLRLAARGITRLTRAKGVVMHVVLLWLLYAVLAFGVRTLVQLRTTGRTGWKLSHAAQPIERIAGALFAASLVAGFAGTWLGAVSQHPSSFQPTELPLLARVTGFVLYVTGTVGTFAAQLAMGKSWRIGLDASERTELVAHGLFRVVRNPIYTAMLATVAGLTLLACSFVTCVALGGLLLALELQVRAVEEPYLARRHGEAYVRYAARVGRFVPLVGRAREPMVGA